MELIQIKHNLFLFPGSYTLIHAITSQPITIYVNLPKFPKLI